MSIPVELDALGEALGTYGPQAYLLSGGRDGRPHIAHVTVTWDGERFRCGVGRSGSANIAACALVSLVWPPFEEGGYSMIVDADASTADGTATLVPTSGVLHRPAPAPDGGGTDGCASDCAPISGG